MMKQITNNRLQIFTFVTEILTYTQKKEKEKTKQTNKGRVTSKIKFRTAVIRGTLNQLCTVKSVGSINGRKRKGKGRIVQNV